MKIKKNTVSKKKLYFLYVGPIFAFIMSSLTKSISGSKNACIFLGAYLFFLYPADVALSSKNNIKTEINIDATFLVIEISKIDMLFCSVFTAVIWLCSSIE